MEMTRRNFIGSAAAAAVTVGHVASAVEGQPLVACVIGDSAQGQYGHSMHRVFDLCPNVRVAGLADPVEAGRQKFGAEAKAERLYADYREMLEKEKPSLVAIGPRWTVHHREYLLACVAAGAHGILEKPLSQDLVEADEIVAAVDGKGLKWGIGFNFRALAEVQFARKAVVEEGLIGEILEVRGRGKEDYRAGGEDLVVLGTHVFDLMRYFLGDPEWVSADVTQDGKPVTPGDRREASEPVGPVAGDRIRAMYGFAKGIVGYFASVKTQEGLGGRWGLDILGSKGMVTIRQNGGARIALFRSPTWAPSKIASAWETIPGAPVTTPANPEAERYLPIVQDVIAKIGKPEQPTISLHDARASMEMIQAVYAAHLGGGRVALPLKERKHPLLG